ncbi:transcription initiation factor TFIID subunit 5-like [Trichogramma pretiosum]|uniref:transcription initiation factor TFIID subunit 5-like n=1 Tax=Trichogramma pretiosum TaxID=7493 RepID=UPI000C718C1E|nr:transcription initiation factor TFIID subunit 5-like [Trichogramma pretiosum]
MVIMEKDNSIQIALLQLLKKFNFNETFELFKKEAHIDESEIAELEPINTDVENVLSSFKDDWEPQRYDKAYRELQKFIETSRDSYKHEMGTILYPVLVHMYLEMVYLNYSEEAQSLLEKHSRGIEDYYQTELQQLSHVTKREHLVENELANTFNKQQFNRRISRDALSILKRFLSEGKPNNLLLMKIVSANINFDIYEGVPRNKTQIEATFGSLIGEVSRTANEAKVYYGLLKEQDVQEPVPIAAEDEDDEVGDEDYRPKKKKAKKDNIVSKQTKPDPNAPSWTRMPLPNLRDIYKIEKIKEMQEAQKRVTLGPDCLPSICFYTLMNSVNTAICAEVSEDSSLLSVGFSDSSIKVWSLVPQKLQKIKDAKQLANVSCESDDVLVRMMDDESAETVRTLYGHTGPVYSLSFSPDERILLSSSEDGTVRLWSLHTWTSLVCYKGHLFPVWSVKFSPHGYYFATGSSDRTARLWATDSHEPLRIFAGHHADVDVVQFHPNSNYLASGSSDNTVRLWDCTTGSQVRLMTGHKNAIYALTFSMDGRILASAGMDGSVLLHDLAQGHLVAALSSHTANIHSLTFSRDGNLLVSGSLDCSIKVWDYRKLTKDLNVDDANVSHTPDVKTCTNNYLLRTYRTKSTPVLTTQFSRRNVMLAIGMFDANLS